MQIAKKQNERKMGSPPCTVVQGGRFCSLAYCGTATPAKLGACGKFLKILDFLEPVCYNYKSL